MDRLNHLCIHHVVLVRLRTEGNEDFTVQYVLNAEGDDDLFINTCITEEGLRGWLERRRLVIAAT